MITLRPRNQTLRVRTISFRVLIIISSCLLFALTAFAAGQNSSDYQSDYTVIVTGYGPAQWLSLPSYSHGTVYNGVRTQEVCWMHVSDGRFTYVIQNVESMRGNRIAWHNCFVGNVGYHYNGRVHGNEMELFIPSGAKYTVRKYVILQTGPAPVPPQRAEGGVQRTEVSDSAVKPTAELAQVTVKSTPGGADITVDGNFRGNTTSVLKLPAGDHNFVITAKGFRTWQRTVTLQPGNSVNLIATLQPEH